MKSKKSYSQVSGIPLHPPNRTNPTNKYTKALADFLYKYRVDVLDCTDFTQKVEQRYKNWAL